MNNPVSRLMVVICDAENRKKIINALPGLNAVFAGVDYLYRLTDQANITIIADNESTELAICRHSGKTFPCLPKKEIKVIALVNDIGSACRNIKEVLLINPYQVVPLSDIDIELPLVMAKI